MTPNQKAFLDMLAFSEGTIKFGDENGYNVIVGGALFYDYSDHPRVLVDLPRLGIKSTAAGRYQLLARYYELLADENSSDAMLGAVILELEARGL